METREDDTFKYVVKSQEWLTASQFYTLTNYSSNAKLLWHRDLTIDFDQDKWLNFPAYCGKNCQESYRNVLKTWNYTQIIPHSNETPSNWINEGNFMMGA